MHIMLHVSVHLYIGHCHPLRLVHLFKIAQDSRMSLQHIRTLRQTPKITTMLKNTYIFFYPMYMLLESRGQLLSVDQKAILWGSACRDLKSNMQV